MDKEIINQKINYFKNNIMGIESYDSIGLLDYENIVIVCTNYNIRLEAIDDRFNAYNSKTFKKICSIDKDSYENKWAILHILSKALRYANAYSSRLSINIDSSTKETNDIFNQSINNMEQMIKILSEELEKSNKINVKTK